MSLTGRLPPVHVDSVAEPTPWSEIWSAGRDLNPRLYGFAGRSLGPLGHRRMADYVTGFLPSSNICPKQTAVAQGHCALRPRDTAAVSATTCVPVGPSALRAHTSCERSSDRSATPTPSWQTVDRSFQNVFAPPPNRHAFDTFLSHTTTQRAKVLTKPALKCEFGGSFGTPTPYWAPPVRTPQCLGARVTSAP